MPAEVVTGAVRMPRRARYLVPRGLPRRGEFIAASAVLIVLVHLIFAQLSLVIAVTLYLVGKLTRWRSVWLLGPAIAGAVWTLAVGLHAAVDGFTAGPARILSYLSAGGHLMHFGGAFTGAGRWLPRQLPLALLAGVIEAGLATWLSWLHTDEWDLPASRPGALVAIRRFAVTRMIKAGGVVTRDGACLGVVTSSGARVGLSWREAAGGVLVCGAYAPDLHATSFQLVHAALRRRKPVLAMDLSGDPGVPRQFAAACTAMGVPLQVFGGAGGAVAGGRPASYEPFRYGPAAHRAELVAGMVNWDGAAGQHRRACAAYLEDVFELLDAAPGDPRVPVLDEVLHLLNPAALLARMRHVPVDHPRHDVLGERIRMSASLSEEDPTATGTLVTALRALRATEPGRWLRQPVGRQLPPIDLGRAAAGRSAVLFCLGRTDDGGMLSRLVCQDLLGLGARLHSMGVDGDGIVWLTGCQAISEPVLRDLIAAGPRTGLAVVATTSYAPAARDLAQQLNTLLVHRVADQGVAQRLAAVASPRLSSPEVAIPPEPAGALGGLRPEVLTGLRDGEFLLSVAGSKRLVPRAQAIRAKIGGNRG